MESVTIFDKTFVPFISNEKIEAAIDRVASEMVERHKNDETVPVMLCVLNGSIPFTAGLMKRVEIPFELMTVKVASYSGTSSTGKINMQLDITGDIRGRKVVIIEDIVDTGRTIFYLCEHLKELGAAEVEVCTLLLKPEVFHAQLKLDYVGLEIENKFIIGYGLDYDQLGRNLKDIYVLK